MSHSNRNRIRSSAQKAGNDNYNDSNNYLTISEIPIMNAFVDSSNNVIDTYYGGNPTASDVNLLLQTEDENRAKLMAEYYNAYLNKLNPIPYAETQVDTNPFGPFNYPSDGNGYGYLGGYNAPNSYPLYDSMARRNPGYTVPENTQVVTSAPFAANASLATDAHFALIPQTRVASSVKRALRSYIKENNLHR